MGLDGNLDITAEHRATVHSLLETYLPGTAVWAYGSRVTWTARAHSDLDLVVFATPEQSNQVGLLREAFEESNLPFRVDLFVWDAVPESFRRTIAMEHVVLSEHQKTPRGRPTRPLRDLAELRLSSVDKKTVEGESNVRLCNYTDVYYNDAVRASIPFMRATATEAEIQKCRLLVNDVVITKDSEKHDDIGVPSLVKETMDDLVCGYHLAILRPRPGTHGPYLFYALSDRRAQHQFHAYANGITRFGLRKADIELVDVPFPPLAEQRAIAGVLGALDDRIELNRRTNQTLEAMARALFKSWFVDFDPVRAKMEGRDTGLLPGIADLFADRFVESELGEIPEGWNVGSINSSFELTMGQSPPGHTYNNEGDGLPFYQGRSDFGFRYPTRRRHCTTPTRIAQPADTIVSVRAPVGDINIASERSCIGRGLAALRHKSQSVSFTYYSCFRLQPDLRRFEDTGTVFGAITKAQFAALRVLDPPTGVVSAFEEMAGPLDRLIRIQETDLGHIGSLRDTLLPRLVSGEVRLPAEVLDRYGSSESATRA